MIYLAADHRGYKLKEEIKKWLGEWNYQFEDFGSFEYDQNDDYPDFVRKAAEKVSQDPENSRAIILGGSGQGEAMVANRYKGVRAAVFYGPSFSKTILQRFLPFAIIFGEPAGTDRICQEIIKMSREHNNANVLSLGASFLDEKIAKNSVKLWLETPFSNEERHIRRINKIDS